MFPQDSKFEAYPISADLLDVDLPDLLDYLAPGDYVRYTLGNDWLYYGVVVKVRQDIGYALVESWNGNQRYARIDDMTLLLKASVLHLTAKAPVTEATSAA